MARRSGGSHKCVEEKRRMLPIYQHYTLSPGRTKSHHPEAKCIHCLKEFVCGSKQRLIRHLRKCNSITNPEQIIAETLNTLARNSATGQLNHSILEASNLLPSQISHIHHSATQHLVGHTIQQHYSHVQQHHPNNNHSSTNPTTITTANNNVTNNIGSVSNSSNSSNINGTTHDTKGSSLANSDSIIVATSSNGPTIATTLNNIIPVRKTRRGRRPANQLNVGSGIHVTTGLDGKTQFTPISQLPPGIVSSSPQIIANVHNVGTRGNGTYAALQQATSGVASTSVAQNVAGVIPTGANHNSGHHIQVTPFKLNSDPIDKAYLKLVLTRNLPISLCDTKEFQNWVKTFANDYKPPTSINLITHNLKQEAQSARQRVSNIIVKATKKTVNLELHCWPDQLRGHLWCAIIAALDSRRFLISVRDVLGNPNSDSNQQISNHTSLVNSNGNNNSHQTIDRVLSNTDHKILIEFIDECIKRVACDRVNSFMFTGRMITEPDIVTRARQAIYSDFPSVVTYHCWWNFTNLLSSDVIENDQSFIKLLKISNLLISYINKQPKFYSKMEHFNPFAGDVGSLHLKKDDPRWYSHLICYLLEYIKNNNASIMKALEDDCSTNKISQLPTASDDNNNNNNNNSSQSSVNETTVNVQRLNNSNSSNLQSTQQQSKQTISNIGQSQFSEVRSVVMSADYWTSLESALVYLKPFKDIVALSASTSSSDTGISDASAKTTPAISTTGLNHLALSEYMNWFLNYGRTLFESWRQSPDRYKHSLIGHYIRRFNESLVEFKLLFAAYLLNPKYRCAYVTQKAKDLAIEEILNIASEFMPEESDGHTIFDQWKLYLVREEPYDMVFDESRSTVLEWWVSMPCAESIRRVASRILRMKAFSTARPESLFSQLYFYEDETRTSMSKTAFEDLAILRYFYDHEDRMVAPSSNHSAPATNTSNLTTSNGVPDRTQVGQAHNNQIHDTNDPARYLPLTGLSSISSDVSNGQFGADDTPNIQEGGELRIFTDAVDSYIDGARMVDHIDSTDVTLSLENLPGYDQFAMYIDFAETGVQILEEPIEKKKRKWTAQEILSAKCQSGHSNGASTNNSPLKTVDK